MSISVDIQSTVRKSVPRKQLERAVELALRHGKVKHAQVDLLIVGDKRMRSLNDQHLGHDYTTDVLSFHLGEDPAGALIGQLVICRSFAERQAKARKISVREELVRYVIHGTLHLLGYDDHDDEDREAMWRVQERLVASALRPTPST